MKKVLIYIGVVLLVSAFGCTSKSSKEEKSGFVVTGVIKNFTGQSVMLEEITPGGLIFVDSSVVSANGEFELKGTNLEKTFYSIQLNDYAIPLVLDTASMIHIEVDAMSPGAYRISGSEDNNTMRALISLNDDYVLRMNALADKYQAQYGENRPMPDSVQKQVRNEIKEVVDSRKAAVVRFIDSLPANSVIAFYALNFVLNETDPARYYEISDRLDAKSFAVIPESKYVQSNHIKVEGLRKTAIGNMAPDIVMNDPSGIPVALSSLRGKYVLVDFWASWCGPCREENPENVRLYNKYKKDGLEIYGVSLDDNRDNWVKAISDDNLTWVHVSDLLKWNSPVIAKYNFEAIPYNVLLDPEGKIIAKNLHGNELENKLATLFN